MSHRSRPAQGKSFAVGYASHRLRALVEQADLEHRSTPHQTLPVRCSRTRPCFALLSVVQHYHPKRSAQDETTLASSSNSGPPLGGHTRPEPIAGCPPTCSRTLRTAQGTNCLRDPHRKEI